MRYLHPVSMNEIFIASGIYQHRQSDGALLVEESWTIHQFPDGAWMIRVDSDRRDNNGASVLIEAWRSPEPDGGKIERFDISAFGPPDAAVKHARCTYSVMDDSIEVGRSIGVAERNYETLSLPSEYALYPGGFFFKGIVLNTFVNQGYDTLPVLVADWQFLDEHAFALNKQIWRVERSNSDAEVVDQVTHYGEALTLEEQNATDGSLSALVDSFGVLLRGEYDHSQVTLSRYARQMPSSK